MKSCILLVFFVFCCNSIFSQEQEAEIFFKDGTSLEGYGMIHKMNEIKFRITQDDEFDIWTSLVVKGVIFYDYNYGGKYEYVKLVPNGPAKLLEVLSEGVVNLYADVTTFNYFSHNDFSNGLPTSIMKQRFTKSHLYVQRYDEEYPTPLVGSFKKKAIKYFSSCKEIVEKLKTGKFRKNNADEMVNYFNDFCVK